MEPSSFPTRFGGLMDRFASSTQSYKGSCRSSKIHSWSRLTKRNLSPRTHWWPSPSMRKLCQPLRKSSRQAQSKPGLCLTPHHRLPSLSSDWGQTSLSWHLDSAIEWFSSSWYHRAVTAPQKSLTSPISAYWWWGSQPLASICSSVVTLCPMSVCRELCWAWPQRGSISPPLGFQSW